MKTYIIAIALFTALLPATSHAQLKLPKALSKITGGSGISEDEAGMGIKEALTQGVTNAVLNLNKTDGFFGSEIYKMLYPTACVVVDATG